MSVAGWIQNAKQLHQLAPSTEIPLTAEKVAGWKKSRGRAYLYCSGDRMIPVGYGEVTPLQRHRDHVWLGHVIIRPEDRGRGIGARFVQELLSEACEALAATRAILVVFPDNISAIRCYRRVGFTVVGEERHRFRAGLPPERLLRLEIDLPV